LVKKTCSQFAVGLPGCPVLDEGMLGTAEASGACVAAGLSGVLIQAAETSASVKITPVSLKEFNFFPINVCRTGIFPTPELNFAIRFAIFAKRIPVFTG
jgi:hypothetical protein